VATFDWLPREPAEAVGFDIRERRYHCPKSPRLDPDHPVAEVTATLLRNTPISGKVLLPDGRPAAGTLLQAEGRGKTNMYCRTLARTAEDGSYSMPVFPDQSYIIAVLDDDWAAPSKTGVIVREGAPVTGLDFRLGPGTVIHGTVRIGPERRPAADKTVTLIEQGPPPPEDMRRGYPGQTGLVRWATTDETGSYSIRVGRGRFSLRGPEQQDTEDLVVTGEAEIVRDFSPARASRGALSGQVIHGKDGSPAAGATLRGESVWSNPGAGGHAGFRAVADQQGAFRTERWRDRLVLYATSKDGSHAALREISEDDEVVTVRLLAAATLVGKVVDAEGRPLPRRQVTCRPNPGWIEGTFRLSLSDVTDEEGRFAIPGVAHGMEWTVRAVTGPSDLQADARVDVVGPVETEVPDLVVRPR
jgi:hypothetical protein